LVVWNINFIFPSIRNVIIPTDSIIFFRWEVGIIIHNIWGVGQPPTRSSFHPNAFGWSTLPFFLFRLKRLKAPNVCHCLCIHVYVISCYIMLYHVNMLYHVYTTSESYQAGYISHDIQWILTWSARPRSMFSRCRLSWRVSLQSLGASAVPWDMVGPKKICFGNQAMLKPPFVMVKPALLMVKTHFLMVKLLNHHFRCLNHRQWEHLCKCMF
jgi:hypothetical protein